MICLGLIHDEVQVQTKPENVERVKEILSYSFGDYITKKLELNIQMDGDAKHGKRGRKSLIKWVMLNASPTKLYKGIK